MTEAPRSIRDASPATSPREPRYKPRLEIFVDGSNFFPSMRDAGILYNVDIWLLARRLAAQPPGYQFNKLHYFTAPSPYPESEAYRRQQKFFAELRRHASITLVLGRLEARGRDERGQRRYQEKETDINLALAMILGACDDRYDVAMLVAGDTDYVPVVKAVQARGKHVVWCHFQTQRHSMELRQVADERLELTEPFLRTCLIPQQRG